MSLSQNISEKLPNVAGMGGIAGIATTEAGKYQGLFENVSAFQFISACGVIWLMVDRTISSIKHAESKHARICVPIVWGTLWVGFFVLLGMVVL